MAQRPQRTVVEDRSPLGPILGVVAVIVLLFLVWFFLFNDGFGNNALTDDTEEQEDTPDINITVPGDIDLPGDGPGTGDDPGGGDEPAPGPDPAGGD